jgi:hypothetical protein
MSNVNLTAARLRELLSYDPETGVFICLVHRGKKKRAGMQDGLADKNGYRAIEIEKRRYRAHRLAWLYMTGEWPTDFIDHINGIKTDNRFCNLRDVTHTVNMQNMRKPTINNSTGYLGVHPGYKGWFKAQINVDGEKLYLGKFKTAEEASEAYLKARRELQPGNTL